MGIRNRLLCNRAVWRCPSGHIRSIDDPITQYAPQLAGGAYDEVTVRNLLQMASGVKWDEEAQKPGAILSFMARLPREVPPGTRFNYSTGETQVAAAVLRGAVKRPLADYLSERISAKFGMESDATWWLESPDGLEIGGSGLSATLRDYGRFGLFMLAGGSAGGEQILPNGWLRDASSPKTVGGQNVDYGYLLWPIPNAAATIHEGAFEARGIFGQHVYMNPRENVVIAIWSALPKPTGKAVVRDYDFFAAVSEALR